MTVKGDGVSRILSVLAIVISAASLWISLRGQEHERIVDFEDRRAAVVAQLQTNLSATDALIDELNNWLRYSDDPEMRVRLSDVLHEVRTLRTDLDAALQETASLGSASDLQLRIAIERARTQAQVHEASLRGLFEKARSAREQLAGPLVSNGNEEPQAPGANE